jgi:hypothetical protein
MTYQIAENIMCFYKRPDVISYGLILPEDDEVSWVLVSTGGVESESLQIKDKI